MWILSSVTLFKLMILPFFPIRRIKNIGHFLLALIAVNYYRNPSKKVKIIGVTGTDGKTTTANYIYQLLDLSGKKSALISTVGVVMNGEKEALGFHVTTPSTFILNKYLKKAIEKKIEYVVLEVSSHALDQFRVLGLRFDVGIITNVTKEHLDYHKSFENYLNTKVKLLKVSDKVILNKSDPLFEKIKSKVANKKIYTYALDRKDVDLSYLVMKNKTTKDLTEYNRKNLLAAMLTLELLGVDGKQLWNKVGELNLPTGRLEYLQQEPFSVVVDFAHTPNAFSSLLPEIKKKTKGRLIHVFGSAGKRDRSKRPDMGNVSSRLSDVIVLTSEDSRGENLDKINSDIRRGIDGKFTLVSTVGLAKKKIKQFTLFQIDDRRKAIVFALGIALPGDSVVITGKGHEESMNMGAGEMPWNDIKIVKELLKK